MPLLGLLVLQKMLLLLGRASAVVAVVAVGASLLAVAH